ncbi:hypothetical protein TYRP_008937 [Tyrophagus putrescentiae]|nr:hypothetical protein TYRP_008937 [Tyrophagus putrescentiae]
MLTYRPLVSSSSWWSWWSWWSWGLWSSFRLADRPRPKAGPSGQSWPWPASAASSSGRWRSTTIAAVVVLSAGLLASSIADIADVLGAIQWSARARPHPLLLPPVVLALLDAIGVGPIVFIFRGAVVPLLFFLLLPLPFLLFGGSRPSRSEAAHQPPACRTCPGSLHFSH